MRYTIFLVIKRLLLFILVFSLPFQLGYHFWLPETYVKSFKIDYLAPTLYLTDIFILLFLVANYKIISTSIRRFLSSFSGLLFIVLVALNLWTSSFSLVTAFAWLKLIEYLLLLVVLAKTKDLGRKILTPFSLSLGLIILLAVIQFALQSSVGGLFYYLGERPLSLALPNIAKLNLPWGQILRPYATFSHPNSLAGYLLVSLVILRQISHSKIPGYLLVGTIFLTFSKSAILALIIIELMRPNLIRSIFLGVVLGLLPLLKLDPSFSSRLYLLLPTLKTISDNPLFGTGVRRFIPNLATHLPGNQISYSTLQPVHNTFLLMLAEVGLVGILLATVIFWPSLAQIIKNKSLRPYFLGLAGIIFMTGSLDHYWWTLPQNQLIIVLALALISNSSLSSPKLGEETPLLRRGEV